MVEITEIHSPELLDAWLEEQSTELRREFSANIVTRMALRSLPAYWSWSLSQTSDQSVIATLRVLRCALASLVAGRSQSAEITVATTRAAEHCSKSADEAFQAFLDHSGNAKDAADAASGVRYAAHSAIDFAFFKDAIAIASKVDGHETAAWKAIRSDCRALEGSGELAFGPLWPDPGAPSYHNWTRIKEIATAPEWAFWIDWYEDLLAGNPMNWETLEQVALIPSDVWDEGPVAVAEKIADIEIEAAKRATPNAEEIRISEHGLYEVVPRSDLPSKTLKDANQRIGDIIQQIRGVQHLNQFAALGAEADLLRDYLDRYSDNPLRLYEVCHKAARHVQLGMNNGSLPEDDNLIIDVIGDLQNTSDDIYNFDREVSATIDARAKRRYGALDADQKVQIGAFVEAVADRSEDNLALELREDWRVVEADELPSEEVSESRYRLGSRLTRIVSRGRQMLRDIRDALNLVEDVGSKVVFYWTILKLLIGFLF